MKTSKLLHLLRDDTDNFDIQPKFCWCLESEAFLVPAAPQDTHVSSSHCLQTTLAQQLGKGSNIPHQGSG